MSAGQRLPLDKFLNTLGKKPDFSEEANDCLQRNRSTAEPYQISRKGLTYTIHPGVFAPDIFEDTFFFMDSIPWRTAGSFLEIGCGAGLISIEAGRRNYGDVLATDISKRAIDNCAANAKRHSLEGTVKVRASNVFSAIGIQEKFDQIFWNLPFIWSDNEPEDDLEACLFDPHYRGLSSYLRTARKHANPNSDILLGFSDSTGHIEAVYALAKEQAFTVTVLAQKRFDDGFNLQLLKFD